MNAVAFDNRRSPLEVFEENYDLLSRLLPSMGENDVFSLSERHRRSDVDIEVVERHKYMTVLRITKYFRGIPRSLPDLVMMVRLYSDAKVAEVVAYQDCQHIPCRFTAQEDPRFHRDEKRQANELLLELLEYFFHRNYRIANQSGFTSV